MALRYIFGVESLTYAEIVLFYKMLSSFTKLIFSWIFDDFKRRFGN